MTITNVSQEGRTEPVETRTFAVPALASDYSMKTNVAGAFSDIALAKGAIIVTDADITIKVNKASATATPITTLQQSLTLRKEVQITDILFASTPGANVTVVLL